jgi:hypothetical protein
LGVAFHTVVWTTSAPVSSVEPSFNSGCVDRIVTAGAVHAAIENRVRIHVVQIPLPHAFYTVVESFVAFSALPDVVGDRVGSVSIDALYALYWSVLTYTFVEVASRNSFQGNIQRSVVLNDCMVNYIESFLL